MRNSKFPAQIIKQSNSMRITILLMFILIKVSLYSQNSIVSRIDTVNFDSTTTITFNYEHFENNLLINHYKIVRTYYDSGNIKEEYDVMNGLIVGQYRSYYSNGSIKEIFSMNQDVKTGLYICYYPNNRLKMYGYYQENLHKDDITVITDSLFAFNEITLETDVIITKENLGIKIGKWYYFKEDGSLANLIDYGAKDEVFSLPKK